MHEQSETVQREDGSWINVYGRALPNAGQQLPNSGSYPTVEEAVEAAKQRSAAHQHVQEQLLRRINSQPVLNPRPAGGPYPVDFSGVRG